MPSNALEKPELVTRVRAGSLREQIALVVCVILDPACAEYPLVDEIAALGSDKRLSSLDLVVLPASTAHAKAMRVHVERWRCAGLRVYFIDNSCVANLARELHIPAAMQKRRSVGINRTLLQHVAAAVGHNYLCPAYWILDGDVCLHGLSFSRRRVRRFVPDYIGEMLRLRKQCDIAIGRIDGAAPLPRAMSVRTQMIDLLHFAAGFEQPRAKRNSPTPTIAQMCAEGFSDYFHDCADHPHLDKPLGLLPLAKNCSRQKFLRELPHLLTRILAGDAVTRPLASARVTKQRQHRGGNTLIFTTDALRRCPNGLVRGGFADMRRQDEVWCVFNRAVLGMRICDGDFPVTQSRVNDPPQAPDMKRVQADIIGHAVTSTLREVVGDKRFESAQQLVDFVLCDASFFNRVREKAQIRAATLRASFFRIVGIAGAMRLLFETNLGMSTDAKAACATLRAIERKFSRAHVRDELYSCVAQKMLRESLADLPNFCRQLVKLAPFKRSISQFVIDAWWQRDLCKWWKDQRQQNAVHLLAKIVNPKLHLRFLGRGGEGTVFTDERHVYKVLHRWYSSAARTDFLCAKLRARRWEPSVDILYPITRHWCDDGDLVVRMPFEKTVPYRGGYASAMVEMLCALHKRGMTAWDIKPDNLRRSGRKLRMLDYGQQIKPLTERGLELSVRKAWLCCHYALREDLRALQFASMNEDAPRVMPELRGYQRIKQAVVGDAVRSCDVSYMPDEVLVAPQDRVLGCGHGDGVSEMSAFPNGESSGLENWLTPKESEAFLRLLGLSRQLPSMRYLTAILRACFTRVPFQNMSMLVGPRRPPRADEIVDTMLRGLGGPCDVNNFFLCALLHQLGFDVGLLSASMNEPDCHIGLLVCIGRGKYWVDYGNGFPYLTPLLVEDGARATHLGFGYRLRVRGVQVSVRQNVLGGAATNTNQTFALQQVHYSHFNEMRVRHYGEIGFGPFLSGVRINRWELTHGFIMRDNIFYNFPGKAQIADAQACEDWIRRNFDGELFVPLYRKSMEVLNANETSEDA